jgi:hypothetical protein
MVTQTRILVLAGAVLAFAGAASAGKTTDRPELFRKLIDCRAMTDSAERLACYDTQVGALDVAEKKRDLVVVDRAQMREARKSLFGFSVPKIGLFGGGKEEAEEDVKSIDSTISSVRRISFDKWSITLSNNAGTWETVSQIKFDPQPGQAIGIKSAMMGSYLGSFGSNKGVRFRRVD